MNRKTITDEEYAFIRSGKWACFYTGFTVGKDYEVVSPSNSTPIVARCTQNCPIALTKVR